MGPFTEGDVGHQSFAIGGGEQIIVSTAISHGRGKKKGGGNLPPTRLARRMHGNGYKAELGGPFPLFLYVLSPMLLTS